MYVRWCFEMSQNAHIERFKDVSNSSRVRGEGHDYHWAVEGDMGHHLKAELLEERVSEPLDFLKAKSVGLVEAIAENVLSQPSVSTQPPRAELATGNIILTIPAADLCHMDNQESLLSIWNKMMNAIARLAAIRATFTRPQRMVADVQTSNGWMHAGYLVMHHLESMTEMIDVQSLQDNGLCGAIHDLGLRQHQSEREFPPHTTKTNHSRWSVYVNETVLGIPRDKGHNALSLGLRKKRIRDYIENRAQLKDWEVFTSLETYLQLQEAFGWKAFTEIFSEYQNMSELPDDNDSKMNLLAETFSHLVKKNVTPFSKA
ncbi:TRPM8 channel-associated factor 2-like [Strix uralensis]|uniref:TRPM8 channel-associated factor 2-like n=1 Tax=Strix uralensis TaxID=36305 RepID=UPI003DA78DB6